MAAHEISIQITDMRAHLVAWIDGYPGWSVAVDAVMTEGGAPVVAELWFYPRQHHVPVGDLLLWEAGDAAGEHSWPVEWTPEMREQPWSGEAQDVPAGGIPTRLLRRVNVGELLNLVPQYALAHGQTLADMARRMPWDFGDYVEMADLLGRAKRKKPGPKGHGLDYYLAWARRYASLAHDGDPHPIKTLAEETDLPHDFVRDTVGTARRYGLLTKTGRGRAGGQLTPKALQLIGED